MSGKGESASEAHHEVGGGPIGEAVRGHVVRRVQYDRAERRDRDEELVVCESAARRRNVFGGRRSVTRSEHLELLRAHRWPSSFGPGGGTVGGEQLERHREDGDDRSVDHRHLAPAVLLGER